MLTNISSLPSVVAEELPNFDRTFGFIISDISRLLRKEFDRRVRGYGLTRAQWLLLYYVARQPGASQSDLADALQLEKITISRHAARLERNGWLERHDHAEDGRAYRLRLTSRATKMIVQLSSVTEQLRDDAMGAIPVSRRNVLIDDLLQIKDNLVVLDAAARNSSR